jgi:hypothetical protein
VADVENPLEAEMHPRMEFGIRKKSLETIQQEK